MSNPVQGHAWGGFGRRPLFRSEVERITSELIGILADRPVQVDVVADLNGSVQRLDFAEAGRRFASDDMWGGAGSVCDIFMGDPALDRRLCELLMQLVKAFTRAGFRNRRASEIATMYENWLKLGIFEDGEP